jgi:CheY-like chemotaxis protein
MERHETVLVVDDSDELRAFVAVLLEDAGYHVEQAADGIEGLEKARQHRPDLILLDVVMPRMDGLDLLLRLRSDLAPPIPPVILCSGFDLTEEEALRRGAERFLRKPIAPIDLLQAIDDVRRGDVASVPQLEAEKLRVSAARQRALNDAGELMRRIEAQPRPRGELGKVAGEHIRVLARFLGVQAGVIAVVHRETLTVIGSTEDCKVSVGADLGTWLPPGYQVLETGSALVLSDAATHPSFSPLGETLGGIRFFVGVPLRASSGMPVGVICLFDPQPRSIEAEDLATLQLFGRNGSAVLALLARGQPALPSGYGAGIWTRAILEHVMEDELRLFHRFGGSMVLAVAAVSDLDAVRIALARSPERERLICGLAGDTRVVLCKRALDDRAGKVMSALLADVRSRTEVRAAGLVDLATADLNLFGPAALVRLAEIALERAEESQSGLVKLSLHVEAAPLPSVQ